MFEICLEAFKRQIHNKSLKHYFLKYDLEFEKLIYFNAINY